MSGGGAGMSGAGMSGAGMSGAGGIPSSDTTQMQPTQTAQSAVPMYGGGVNPAGMSPQQYGHNIQRPDGAQQPQQGQGFMGGMGGMGGMGFHQQTQQQPQPQGNPIQNPMPGGIAALNPYQQHAMYNPQGGGTVPTAGNSSLSNLSPSASTSGALPFNYPTLQTLAGNPAIQGNITNTQLGTLGGTGNTVQAINPLGFNPQDSIMY